MPRLLLVSTTNWPMAARLAARFSRHGWGVDLLAPMGTPARLSRYVETAHDYAAFSAQKALKAAIDAASPDLVIPCDDRAAGLLLRAWKTGGPHAAIIARSLGAPAAYDTLTTRADFLAAAAEEGIAIPETLPLECAADLGRALAQIGLPAVLKSDGSWGGEGVAIIHTRKEARAAFQRMSRPMLLIRAAARALKRGDAHHLSDALCARRPRLSLQAYIPGTPATTAFSCWQGKLLSALHADVVTGAGGTGPASVVRITEDAAMQQAAIRIARRFALSGFHGLDFIRDAEGRVHLLEINPRTTQIAALAMGAGRDPAAALAAALAPQAANGTEPAIANNLVALFPQESRRDPASPWLSRGYHDVPHDDPALLNACLEPATPRLFARWRQRLRALAPAHVARSRPVLTGR
jgi:hypothetical protein